MRKTRKWASKGAWRRSTGAGRTMGLKLRATGGRQDVSEAEIRRALNFLPDPQHGFEVCSIPAGVAAVRRGDDSDGILAAVRALPGGKGVYFRLNPVPATMGDRCARVED